MVAAGALEAGQEFLEDLLLLEFARDHVGVVAAVEDAFQVLASDDARAVGVHYVEAPANHVFSAFVERVAQPAHEFLVGNLLVIVDVEELEEGLHLVLRERTARAGE